MLIHHLILGEFRGSHRNTGMKVSGWRRALEFEDSSMIVVSDCEVALFTYQYGVARCRKETLWEICRSLLCEAASHIFSRRHRRYNDCMKVF